jgi:hypothetical protein
MALQRDPESAQAKQCLMNLKQPQKEQQESKPSEQDARIAIFENRLKDVQTQDTGTIRSFVSSQDFVQVLMACGTTETSPRVKSLAFMILTQLFNPVQSENYPMQFIIDQCAACFSHCMDQGKNDSKLLAYRTLNAIFQTSMTVGATILSQEGVVEEIMDTVEFEVVPVQIAVTEVLTSASSDKSCRKEILKYSTDWLAKLASQKKTDPQLKAAAGTALSKLRAQSDIPTNDDPAKQGEQSPNDTLKESMRRMNITGEDLVDSLKQVVISKSQDMNLVLNAVEGLAYSSLRPEIKDNIGNDGDFLKALSTLTISAVRDESNNMSNPLLFGIGTLFANITQYRPVLDEQQKQMKKLRDLANAKQSGAKPQQDEDPRENDAAVEQRIKKAVANGVSIALMVLSKNSSVNIRAVAAQTYLNLVTPQSTRGQLLQQGVLKALLPLSRANESITNLNAAQALARLAITADPRIAFVGDTILDLVRPFLLLCKDTNQLRQFEGLMALTNLASVDERVRLLADNADGMTTFENLQLSSNDMVQRAATEMVCNMTLCDPVFERYSDPKQPGAQNRIRLLMILSDHEDPATRRAASGALAILANCPSTCDMLIKVDKYAERMGRWLSSDETVEVHHRGLEIIRLTIENKGKSVVDDLVKEHVDQKLVALVKSCKVQMVQSLAVQVLKLFVENGVKLNV